MSEFQIEIESAGLADQSGDADAPRGISIRANNIVLSKLLREGSNQADDYVAVPLARLAFWLLDHWWRLRWESIPPAGITPECVIREGEVSGEILRLIEEDEDIAILVLAAAADNEGPGPLVSSLGKTAGSFPVPIAIVPGHLTDEELDAMS